MVLYNNLPAGTVEHGRRVVGYEEDTDGFIRLKFQVLPRLILPRFDALFPLWVAVRDSGMMVATEGPDMQTRHAVRRRGVLQSRVLGWQSG